MTIIRSKSNLKKDIITGGGILKTKCAYCSKNFVNRDEITIINNVPIHAHCADSYKKTIYSEKYKSKLPFLSNIQIVTILESGGAEALDLFETHEWIILVLYGSGEIEVHGLDTQETVEIFMKSFYKNQNRNQIATIENIYRNKIEYEWTVDVSIGLSAK
jgi:hypothetical protein